MASTHIKLKMDVEYIEALEHFCEGMVLGVKKLHETCKLYRMEISSMENKVLDFDKNRKVKTEEK